jgi:AraC family transcriptional regulator
MRVLVHVQTHLDADLSLGALARVAGLSPFHFEREFTRVVGETVKAYASRLRLERAAVALLLQRARIVDVALDSGFRNHETFSRAFRRQYGISPSRYRAEGLAPPDPPAPSPPPAAATPSLSATTLCELDSLHLAFIRHVGPYEDVDPRMWDDLGAWARRRSIPGPHVLLGIGHDAPGITPPAKLRFDAALRVPGPFQARGRIGHQVLPGGLFARTTHAGPLTTLPEVYPEIFDRVARRKDVTLVGLPVIEVYQSQRIRPDWALNHTDIYIPVARRTA